MIKNLYKTKPTLFSFEVFPPKKDDDFPAVFDVLDRLKNLHPDFVSVTYGAGGSNSKKNLEIASYLQNKCGIEALAHLTSVGLQKEALSETCKALASENISNILALRGDRPQAMTDKQYDQRSFHYANEMITFLKENTSFCLGAACYPEKHFEADSLQSDLLHMKNKAACGADFFISQLFLDNDKFYRLMETSTLMGITAPISAGIMPITSAKQLGTIVSMSGTSVPKRLSDLIAKYGDHPSDMKRAGIEYAINQINDILSHGVSGIHIYTMNKPETAETIMKAVQ